jgi:hypothetical protein
MNPSTLIVSEPIDQLTVLTVYSDRMVRNTPPDRSSLAQARALAAYIQTVVGGSLLTTGQTVAAPTGETLTAL